MTEQLITNCLGTFIIQNKKIMAKILFKNPEEYKNKKLVEQQEKQLLQKHPQAKKTDSFVFPQHKEFLHSFFEQSISIAKEACKAAVKKEHLIMQAVEAMQVIEKAANPLTKKLRDWYALYCPEISEGIEKHEAFVNTILTKEKAILLKEWKINTSMGADISKADLQPMREFAESVQQLYDREKALEQYLEKAMQDIAPNLIAVAGATLGAQLLSYAGSLKKLAGMPSSTIQLLGAENALFRHLRKQGRSPRHGIIVMHPLLASAKNEYHGKIARRLAGAISIAAKLDYFHGDQYKGYELREKLEKQVKEIEKQKKRKESINEKKV